MWSPLDESFTTASRLTDAATRAFPRWIRETWSHGSPRRSPPDAAISSTSGCAGDDTSTTSGPGGSGGAGASGGAGGAGATGGAGGSGGQGGGSGDTCPGEQSAFIGFTGPLPDAPLTLTITEYKGECYHAREHLLVGDAPGQVTVGSNKLVTVGEYEVYNNGVFDHYVDPEATKYRSITVTGPVPTR